MKLFDELELIDLAIYTNSNLILTNFHIGYEEALNKQGLMIPRFQFEEIMKRLENIFQNLEGKEIQTIIVNGDLKHEFGTISDQEWRHVLKLLDYLGRHCKEVILIKGNHDASLGPIARKRNVKVLEHYFISPLVNKPLKNENSTIKIGATNNKVQESFEKISICNQSQFNDKKTIIKAKKNIINKILNKNPLKIINKNHSKNRILVIHGDEIPDKKILELASTIIIGHEHPAVSVRDGARSELFKAYLVGKWQSKNIIVQPSFNLVTEGTDMLREEVLSPFLKGNLGKFDAVIVADKLYSFGKLKNL